MSDEAADDPALATTGTSLESAVAYAWAAYHAHHWEESFERWQQVQLRWPRYAPACLHAATSLWEMGKQADATALLRRAHEQMPSDPELLISLCQYLHLQKDTHSASELLESAIDRFPYNPEVASFFLKLAHELGDSREVLRRGQVVSMTHPTLPANDDGVYSFLAEARRRLGLESEHSGGFLGDPVLFDDRKLMLQFEGLGENCEFGLVQKNFECDPPGLLRWTATFPHSLIQALNEDFDGVGSRLDTRLVESGSEYATTHRVYGMGSHTFIPIDRERESEIYEGRLKILSYLRDKILEDLRSGEKIFVYHLEQAPGDAELRSLHRAIARHGSRYLLQVRQVDDGQRPGSVHECGNGLMVGYLERLGPDRTPNGDIWNIPYHSWLKLCRAAYLLRLRADAARKGISIGAGLGPEA